MEKLIVSAAIVFALGSICGCAGDTSDDEPEQAPAQAQTQQALNGLGNGAHPGGVAGAGLQNGATPRGNQASHKPPQSQEQFQDPTQGVGGD